MERNNEILAKLPPLQCNTPFWTIVDHSQIQKIDTVQNVKIVSVNVSSLESALTVA